MNINLKLMLLVFIASSFFNISYSSETSPKVALVYANGVLNSKIDRFTNLRLVQSRLLSLYKGGKIDGLTEEDFDSVKPVLATNKSEFHDSLDKGSSWITKIPLGLWGAFSEAAEVLLDYGQETPFAIVDFLLGSDPNSEQEHDGVLMSTMKDAYHAFIRKVAEYTDEDLTHQFDQYRELFGNEYSVVAVVHSHGNLLTRKSYYSLINREYINPNSDILMKDRFYLLSVGSPVKMEMADDFLLDVNDPIGLLSLTFDNRGKVNKETDDPGKDANGFSLAHHSFSSYMSKPESSKRINDFLINSVKSIAEQPVELESKIINISAITFPTSGTREDIEFEVKEVSYKDAEGRELDKEIYSDTMTSSDLHSTIGLLSRNYDGTVSYSVDLSKLGPRTEITLSSWNKTGDTVQITSQIDSVDTGESAIIDFMPYYNRDFAGSDIPYFVHFGNKLIITRIEDTNQYDIKVERVYPDYDRTIDIQISGNLSALPSLHVCERYTFSNSNGEEEWHDYCKTVKGNMSYIANQNRPHSVYKGQDIAGNVSYNGGVFRYVISDYTTNNDERQDIDKALYPKGELRNLTVEAGSNSGLEDSTYYNFDVRIETSWRTVSGNVRKSDAYGGSFLFMYVEPDVDYINLL